MAAIWKRHRRYGGNSAYDELFANLLSMAGARGEMDGVNLLRATRPRPLK
ncbi:hypothetical protein [Arthrobacter sp. KNU40]